MKNKLLFVTVLIITMLGAHLALAEKQAHKEYAEAKQSECSSCHKAEGIAPNHDSDWLRGHRVLAGKPVNNCKECHAQSWCLDCHTGGGLDTTLEKEANGKNYVPRSHRNDFISRHPLEAANNPQQCYRCHNKATCTECHERYPKGSLKIKSHFMLGPNGQKYQFAIGEHSLEARRNLQSCAVCHPEGDVCVQCHSQGKTNPHPRNWGNLRDGLRSKSKGRTCIKCHTPGSF